MAELTDLTPTTATATRAVVVLPRRDQRERRRARGGPGAGTRRPRSPQPTRRPPAVAGRPRSPPTSGPTVFGSGLYGDERDELPDTAVLASLGCGNPTAMADSHGARSSSTSGPAAASTCCSRPARGADRHGVRPGHDRRDAGAGQGQPGEGRREQRELAQGPHRRHPAACGHRRRRALELRHQPLHRQAAGVPRGRPGPQARAVASRCPT